jgi:dipeptidyl aminopeptidase/acylaminoacyl peptidase
MTEPRMLSFEQAVAATLVSDVQIAPDGQQVAYVTAPASAEGEAPVSQIWLVSAAGGPPRRLTTSEGIDGAPRWAPDGRRIAFISDRKQRGTSQLYLLDLSGGEATRLTDGEGAAGAPAWSPDGTKLAFTVRDAETEEEKKRKEERDDAKVIDGSIKRAGLWMLDVPDDPAAAAALPETRRVSPEGMHIGSDADAGFSWAPDGSALVAACSPSPKADDTFSPELVVLSLDGEAKRLGRYEGALLTPKYNADGSTIAFVGAEEVIPALFSLQTIPATGGEPRIVLPGYEGSFYVFHWLPEGDRILAMVETGQRSGVQVVDLEAGDVRDAFEPFEQPGSIRALSLTPDGTRAAFVRADDTSFGEVYVADLSTGSRQALGGSPRKLTDLNPWTREHDFGAVREIAWTSFDGMQIQGIVILPVGYQPGQRYPLHVHIHGGPCGAWTRHLFAGWHDWGQFLAQRGYAVFLPNPRGSSGRGTTFLCEIVGCYGEPDFQDIMTGVDHLIDEGIADPDQLVVGGWSGGGFLTNWTITHTDRFKAAISGAGIANWVSFQGTADVRSVFDRYLGDVTQDVDVHWRLSPIRTISQAKTPTLILYGEADARVPPSQGHELYEGLKSRGVETQLVLYPREPHGIGERKHQLDLLQRVVDWYDRHLGRQPAT